MNIAEVKSKYGDRLTLLGNLDCAGSITEDSQERVIEEVKDILRKASPGGGHVFTSSNCIHSGVNYRSFLTMVDSVKKYGVYPISI